MIGVDLLETSAQGLQFRDESFRWAQLVEFTISDGQIVPQDALTSLLQHPRYREYWGGYRLTTDGNLTHGPFPLDAIAVESFAPSDLVLVVELLLGFAAIEPLNPDLAKAWQRLVERALAGRPEAWHLSHHDWGWVVSEFVELVVIERETRMLRLLIAGID